MGHTPPNLIIQRPPYLSVLLLLIKSPAMGSVNPDGPDPAAPNLSQGFITAVAARCFIFMEADNPKIGPMYFIAVSMAEVSTCEATVKFNDLSTRVMN